MRVTALAPRGFCHGVVDAWALTMKLARANQNKVPMYMVGRLVHNDRVVEQMRELGVALLDDEKTSRVDLVRGLPPPPAILVFSAHGTDPKALSLARKRGFEVHDATCREVRQTHDLLLGAVGRGEQVVFIGRRGHPETLAALALDERIAFAQTAADVADLPASDGRAFATNQTTLSLHDIHPVVAALRRKYKDLSFANELCSATRLRQEAVMEMDATIDALVVVGDQKSSNSNRLAELGSRKGVPSMLVADAGQLERSWFAGRRHVAVTAGASTPTETTRAVIARLSEWSEQEGES